MVRVVDQGIGIESRIGHHAVDEVVHDGRDAVDTAEPLVKIGRSPDLAAPLRNPTRSAFAIRGEGGRGTDFAFL